MSKRSTREDALASNIDKARKQITILFTDIVESSRYWDQFGDVRGRMMVDMHNRLVFPIIKKFKGRVIKTIGDGLMVAFKHPKNALDAAIGIQQILHKMRTNDRSFHAKVRIGLHTGTAIVEQNDVFGDMVNLAKRVESLGNPNEILISANSAELIHDKKYALYESNSFIPKGKRETMTVYRCRWNEHKDLTGSLKLSVAFPLEPLEKGDLLAYSLLSIATLSILYLVYLRYLLAASDWVADSIATQALLLNPLLIISEQPQILGIVVCVALGAILGLIYLKNAPYTLFQSLKGLSAMGLGFVLIYVPIHYFQLDFANKPGQEIFNTERQFVRLPYADAERLIELDIQPKNWYRLLEQEIILVIEPDNTSLQRQLRRIRRTQRGSETDNSTSVWSADNLSLYYPSRFYFRFFDLCALSAGVLGFALGFMNFTIRPS